MLTCACVCVRLRVHVCVSVCAYVWVCACVSVCVITPLLLPTLAAIIMACTTSSKLATRNGENRTRICVVRRFMFCKRVADSLQQGSCRRVADSVQRGTSPQLSNCRSAKCRSNFPVHWRVGLGERMSDNWKDYRIAMMSHSNPGSLNPSPCCPPFMGWLRSVGSIKL